MTDADIVGAILDGRPMTFLGAHPDDESLVGPLLAFAADHTAVKVVCVTSGQSGWNLGPANLTRTLSALRETELSRACEVLGASVQVLGLTNGTSTAHPEGLAVAESEEQAMARWEAKGEWSRTPEQVLRDWDREQPAFASSLCRLIGSLAPGILVTFESAHGFTNHVEHRAVGLAIDRVAQAMQRADGTRGGVDFYRVVSPTHAQAGDARVSAARLTATGERDYLELSLRALSRYETQFGPLGSDKIAHSLSGFRSVMETMVLRPG
ncbi:MAG: PIG-L family deacetylase [Phycisphaerae bacterium]